ncbi:MAG: EAL domain-containing protein [Methylobacteriaceae bacterium]|nr:EAL domain-containing protein [Methylobacteriaceae bacterium]
MPSIRPTIAARLYLLIGVATFALLFVIAAAVFVSGRMVEAGEELHRDGVAGVQEASRLALLFERQRALASRAPAEIELQRQQVYRAAFDSLSGEIEASRLRLEGLVPSEMRGKTADLAIALADFHRHAASVFDLSSNFVQDQAMQILDGPFAEVAARIDASVQMLLDAMRQKAQSEVEDLLAARGTLLGTIAGVSLAALALLLGLGVLLVRNLSRRLQRMTSAMTAISLGSGAGVAVPPTGDRDELGEMARALEVFGYNAEQIARLQVEQDRMVAALKSANEDLLDQNMRFDVALSNMSQGLCMFDGAQRLIVCNQRYATLYGLSPDLMKPGTTLREIVEHRAARGLIPVSIVDQYLGVHDRVVAKGGDDDRVQELSDGRIIAISHREMPGGGWLATHEDITERRRNEAKISHMARHDPLTDLPNRTSFYEKMEECLARVRKGEPLAVLTLDLDHFKSINDTLGHPVGDKLLQAVTMRLCGCTREGDVAARLGGDEFGVVQTAVGQPEDVTALATRLIETIGAPYELEGHQVIVGISVGIAMAPGDGTQPGELMKNADLALYRAKADGGGTYRFFEPHMDARMQARRALELDLRRALANDEFELHYQPVMQLKSGRVAGFEALIRWHHPERGMVPPLDFIPLAEEIGLITPLGEWVLRRACREAAGWPSEVRVSVNLSPAQFKSRNLVQAVAGALDESGLPASRLELEITESVLLQNSEATRAILDQLQDLGVKIAMDDFGTGYSSLSYLRSFPFDKIKIDRSFVHDLFRNPECRAIVRAVVDIGNSLGIETTAEGVETFEQLEELRSEGCAEVQGYLFSPARPAGEVRELLAALSPRLQAIA